VMTRNADIESGVCDNSLLIVARMLSCIAVAGHVSGPMVQTVSALGSK